MKTYLDSYILADQAFPWLFPLLVFAFGACIGSFLNVCIYRIPLQLSVIKPKSSCPKCGRPIAWYDNIPIFSWFILRGKSRCCKQPYSIRYPVVEFLTAFFFWLTWILFPPMKAIFFMVFIAMMIVSAFIDLDYMIIPDRFTIGGFILGLLLSMLIPQGHIAPDVVPFIVQSMQALVKAIIGGFVGSALILWVTLIAESIMKKEAMGVGDIKLMGAIGAFCGWKGAVFALFGGSIVGVLLFPLILAMRKKYPVKYLPHEEDHEEYDPSHIPFGPSLVLGSFIYLFLAHDAVDLYFSLVGKALFG